MIPLTHFLLIGAALFAIGLFIVLTKKNIIQVLIGIEFMLNASILNLVAFGKYDKLHNNGQLFALFVIILAAAAVAVALGIVLNVYRQHQTIDPSKIDQLKD
jgi:NADH:ubiquinone oxidoreductase subunit K